MPISTEPLDSTADASLTTAEATPRITTASIRVLAYVHLRNIHRSTGAGRTARQIIEHLAARKDVDLGLLVDQRDKERILPLVGEPWTNFRYRSFSRDTSMQQAWWLAFDRPDAQAYGPEAEILYCTGESYVPKGKARLVVTAHDASYFETEGHKRDVMFWKTRLKWTLLFNKLARHADMIHTVSNFSAERLAVHFPALANRIQPIHNGVAPLFFNAVDPSGLAYLSDNGLADRPYILIPGGLHYRKNADLILAAMPLLMRRFPSLIVAVVNHNNPAYASLAGKFSPYMRLMGFVTDEALHALYTRASVVWFPSRYEGFGLPVVEAMACDTPVVASSTSSIPEVAGCAALLADPDDLKSHVDAITLLLTDDRASKQFAKAGRDRARRFTWDQTAAKLFDAFAALK